jgi:hypothetical protein
VSRLVIYGRVNYGRFDQVFCSRRLRGFKGRKMETLRLLGDYFPMAVFTGKCLVFISEDWRVELTEHKDNDFSKSEREPAVIRVKIFRKALNGEFVRGHYEDFQLASMNELAEQIEKYVQSAIGTNLREQ